MTHPNATALARYTAGVLRSRAAYARDQDAPAIRAAATAERHRQAHIKRKAGKK